MIKSHQKAIHTNGYQINYRHRNAYGQSTGSDSHSDSHTDRRSSGWSMNDGWYANHNDRGYDRGYSNHRNTRHTNSTTETGRTPTNTVNKAPTIVGTTFPKSLYYNSKNIKIDLSSLAYTNGDNNTVTSANSYKIYKQYCETQNGTYDNWQQLSEQSSLIYNWNATELTAGWYKIGVTAYDGGSWSAEPNGNGWKAAHSQLYTSGSVTASNNGNGYTKIIDDKTDYDTTYAAESSPIRIYHYSSPANDDNNETNWNTDYYTVDNIEQVQRETNKVLGAMGQNTITFTNTPVVSNFTIITWQDMQELRSGVSTAYQLRKDEVPSLSAQTDWVENQKIIDIQDLLDILGQGDE